ncbi:hypothetical protein QR680_013746 [Steinernema hermaphroditum]|uniref:Fatty-acid and retinol-binding protein 1 n=1 Tax=Steinernema hermaphroditum TaxID=289476 RepID=A0AA39I853_9BILA|nr:hypothetical protein QR680_013746 [Steinernema hermaphroditum]
MAVLNLLVLALCATLVVSLPIPDDKETREFLNMLPEDIRTFYESLTENDLKALSAMEEGSKGNGPAEAEDVMDAQYPELAQKMNKMITALTTKIDSLPEEAKKFMTEVFEKLIPVSGVDDKEYQKGVDQVIADADKLSPAAVEDILKVFPNLKIGSN